MKNLIVLIFVATILLGCNNSPEIVADSTPQSTTLETKANALIVKDETVKQQESAKQQEPSINPLDVSGITFSERIRGSDSVQLTRSELGKPVGTNQLDGPELVSKIVEFVGPKNLASDGVPRCIGEFRTKFMKADNDVTTFHSICVAGKTVVLSNGKISYNAKDPEGLIAFLKKHGQ